MTVDTMFAPLSMASFHPVDELPTAMRAADSEQVISSRGSTDDLGAVLGVLDSVQDIMMAPDVTFLEECEPIHLAFEPNPFQPDFIHSQNTAWSPKDFAFPSAAASFT